MLGTYTVYISDKYILSFIFQETSKDVIVTEYRPKIGLKTQHLVEEIVYRSNTEVTARPVGNKTWQMRAVYMETLPPAGKLWNGNILQKWAPLFRCRCTCQKDCRGL